MQSISVLFRSKLSVKIICRLHSFLFSLRNLGFGDICPTSAGARVFNSFYIAGGMLNLALAVALIREVLLEGVALAFQARVKAIRTRQRERRIRTRWRTAVKLRLRVNNLPLWVADNDKQDWHHHHHHHWWRWPKRGWDFLRNRLLSREPADKCRSEHLNLRALTEAQMEDAALEAGAPLADLLPPGLQLTSLDDDIEVKDDEESITDRGGVPVSMNSITVQDEAILEDTVVAEDKIAFVTRLTVALLVFIVFWMVNVFRFSLLRHV